MEPILTATSSDLRDNYCRSDYCYVCHKSLGAIRNSLDILMSSGTPLAKILDRILRSSGVLNKVSSTEIKDQPALCQDCFITLENYDKLQQLAKEIEESLTDTFHKTHLIKNPMQQEENVSQAGIEEKNLLMMQCQGCGETFHSYHDMKNHRHVKKKLKGGVEHAQRKGDDSLVSPDFMSIAKKHGIKYDFDRFQNAFFTKKERNQQGNEYPLKTFQKVHKNFDSGLQKIANDVNKKDVCSLKLRSAKNQSIKPQRTKVNEEFLETLKNDGVDYNLAVFHRAFGYSEKSKDDVQNQIQESEEQADNYNEDESSFECKSCGAVFQNRSNLLRHTKTHIPKNKAPYCETCSKSFKSAACFQIHLATNHGQNDGPFDCPICFKTFNDRSALRSHFYIHSTERSFLCGRCGATFVHKKSFDMHMLVHDDIRNFKCKVPGCDKKFRNAGKLKIHLRVHTGEKIYECSYCVPVKRFAQQWGRDLHVRNHHMNKTQKPELCKVCGIKIQTADKMKMHLIKVHQIDEPSDESKESD